MLASFGTGALLKFSRGDAAVAHRRLGEGLDIAKRLQLPRLQARLLLNSVRIAALSGEPIDDLVAQRITLSNSERLGDTDGDTAELVEAARIRMLLIEGTSSACDEAVGRARACRDRGDQHDRPRAHLRATLLLTRCLDAAGNRDEAVCVLGPALRTCAALGLSQLLIDEGPQMVRLAQDAVDTVESGFADQAPVNLRDFVSNLVETSGH
jgi:hypothetical protein